jgi:hypothetical protein
MELNGQISRRIIIFSLGAMILPLVVFPARLGTEVARASLINALYELVYYGVVVYIFHRRTTLLKLVQGAGVCLIYRMAMGAVFGLLVAAMYSMQVRASLTLGMSGYLPALLFHAAVAPFILKPVVAQLYPATGATHRPLVAPPPPPERRKAASIEKTAPVIAHVHRPVSKEPIAPSTPASRPTVRPVPSRLSESGGVSARDGSGFDRAVNYVGEHSSVHLAAVVDSEGLLLAGYRRGQVDPEDWAPLALLFLDGNRQVLERARIVGLEKVDLVLKDKRVVVASPEGCHLVVFSERHDDDLLNIRINQGLDMINKYVAERYGDKLNPNAERIHVPSA